MDIFDYSDFRLFLQEAYEYRKAEWKHFSHRYIAQKLDVSSGYFSKIVKGKLKLGEPNLSALCDTFGIFGQERLYFEEMVSYTQAKEERDRLSHYWAMQGLKNQRQLMSVFIPNYLRMNSGNQSNYSLSWACW